MDPAQSHEPEARAVALLGMRAALEDARDEPPGGGAGLFGPRDQPRRRPFGVRPMRPRHVRELRGKSAAAGEARMRGDAPPVEEDFDGRLREARLDPRVHELIRHAVEVVVHLDVIIDVDATRLPFGQLVARARQGLERGPIELLEERAPADAGDLHRTLVDGVDALANGGVQIGEREERAVPQRRQDPALRDLDTDFDFRFVGRRRRRARE